MTDLAVKVTSTAFVTMTIANQKVELDNGSGTAKGVPSGTELLVWYATGNGNDAVSISIKAGGTELGPAIGNIPADSNKTWGFAHLNVPVQLAEQA